MDAVQVLVKGEESKETDSLMFYFAMKDGEKTGVALIEVHPGLWGPQKCIVALDLAGRVTNLAVMSYLGERCRPIATGRFLEQFIGKTSECPLTVGKDVDAVSGATISSRTTAFAVKKVVALYETVFPPAEKKGERLTGLTVQLRRARPRSQSPLSAADRTTLLVAAP